VIPASAATGGMVECIDVQAMRKNQASRGLENGVALEKLRGGAMVQETFTEGARESRTP